MPKRCCVSTTTVLFAAVLLVAAGCTASDDSEVMIGAIYPVSGLQPEGPRMCWPGDAPRHREHSK